MKQFTVVFPVYKGLDGKVSILLGQQPEGKPLAGYVNGYGGKVEQNESIEDAAKRELFEELGVAVDALTEIGKVLIGEKEVTFFLTEIPRLDFKDTEEMICNTWHDISDPSFISKMLPGDNILIEHIREAAPKFFNYEPIGQFIINKEGAKIAEATKSLDTSLEFLK